MTDEEKKAIKTLKSDLEFCKSLRKRYRDEQQERDYEIVLNLIEKQSKVIDEMANSLLVHIIGSENCKYDENHNCEKNNQIYSSKNYRDIKCKDCIKQYFYRKVGNNNES